MQSNEALGKPTYFRRYKKLSEEPILLGNGSNPPIHPINQDYKQQPRNPRKCVQCAKVHDTIVENTMTGKRIQEIDKCRDCITWATFNPIKEQVTLSDKENEEFGKFMIDLIQKNYPATN